MKRFEYKHIRLDYKGRGITQEINILDIDGERIRAWGDNTEVPTLPGKIGRAPFCLEFRSVLFRSYLAKYELQYYHTTP